MRIFLHSEKSGFVYFGDTYQEAAEDLFKDLRRLEIKLTNDEFLKIKDGMKNVPTILPEKIRLLGPAIEFVPTATPEQTPTVIDGCCSQCGADLCPDCGEPTEAGECTNGCTNWCDQCGTNYHGDACPQCDKEDEHSEDTAPSDPELLSPIPGNLSSEDDDYVARRRGAGASDLAIANELATGVLMGPAPKPTEEHPPAPAIIEDTATAPVKEDRIKNTLAKNLHDLALSAEPTRWQKEDVGNIYNLGCFYLEMDSSGLPCYKLFKYSSGGNRMHLARFDVASSIAAPPLKKVCELLHKFTFKDWRRIVDSSFAETPPLNEPLRNIIDHSLNNLPATIKATSNPVKLRYSRQPDGHLYCRIDGVKHSIREQPDRTFLLSDTKGLRITNIATEQEAKQRAADHFGATL